VGYIVAAIKDLHDVRVGDTVTDALKPAPEQLPGYKPIQQMVYCDFYPAGKTQYEELRDAMDRLQLNDSSFSFAPENSDALGFGFRCGFLGLLHMEIVQERIEREFNIGLLATAPSVEYEVLTTRGELITIDNPSALPDLSLVDEIREPWMDISIIAPKRYIGTLMDLVTSRRGEFEKMDYLDEDRVHLTYKMPLGELIVDFYDELKSRTQGYASLDYALSGLRASALVKLDILVNGQSVDALSMITHRDEAYGRGRQLIERLRALIPRQMFDVPLQASIGSRIIARETIRAMRKNVIAKCYGGDVSRKRKLLEKQKEGKARMKMVGSVEIPQEAFMAVLSLGEKASAPK
jgi:GTP-binding protein LepA